MARGRTRHLSAASMDRIARELGVQDLVEREGWGAVPSRTCGMVVRVALEHAQRILADSMGRGRR